MLQRSFLEAAVITTGLSLFIVLTRVMLTGSSRFTFVPWNLLLCWVPFAFSIALVANLERRPWRHWHNLLLSLLWLVFLPNTWYVLTDFIHVRSSGQASQMFDIVLVTSLVITGFGLGYASLLAVHRQLRLRMSGLNSALLIEAVILFCSFAIYIGRDLRWNSWDVIADPTGILLDVSDRLVNPFGYPRAISITVMFFVLISAVYAAIWRMSRTIDSISDSRT